MTQNLVVGNTVDHAPGLRTYIGQLQGTPNFNRPSLMPRGGDRKLAVANELLRVNRNSMGNAQPALDALKAQGLVSSYQVNPLSNTVVIDVPDGRTAAAWTALNKVNGMGQIVRNREVHLSPIEMAKEGAALVQPRETDPTPTPPAPTPPAPTPPPAGPVIEWSVAKVNAPAVWAQGFKGQGITVGIVDTGADIAHPNLKARYRGTNSDGTTDNNYNWFDAVGGRVAPYDDNKHGTHVTGTAVGSTPERATGMAPEAKFISSKILSASGSGTLEGVTKGLEWMLAPRDNDGKNADPTKAPDVVSNSWGTTNGKLTAFQNIWKAFVAAGIEPVAAAGNSGPRAGSVGAPGSYPEGISVAATDKDDTIASFSSRGPSPIKGADGNDRRPDLAAPGKDVTSSVPGGGYATFSGTSMATPAVTGVIALLLSKHKDLTHAETLAALQQGAVDLGTAGYDYTYGAGRMDAAKSLTAADAIVKARKPATPPPPTTPPAQPPARS